MGKKSKRRSRVVVENKNEQKSEFPDIVEERFKSLLRVMSWVVGICFALIIILPNFDFVMVDIIVKIIFFFGVFNLIMFGVLEMFGNSVKRYIGPRSFVDEIIRRFSRTSSGN
jgi:hypothetical protein